MTRAESLQQALLTVEVNERFTKAILQFRDQSSLIFCHSVAERWANASGPGQNDDETGLAGELLSAIRIFRLNAKHLDIQFEDNSRWDEALRKP